MLYCYCDGEDLHVCVPLKFSLGVSVSNLSGKKGNKECETHSTEKCRWNSWFEHPVLVAWRDFSRGTMLWNSLSTCYFYSVQVESFAPLVTKFLIQERVKAPLFCSINRTSHNRYGYVANLCVAKSARRQGIASHMLHFAVESATSDGKMEVKLESRLVFFWIIQKARKNKRDALDRSLAGTFFKK